MLDSEKKNREPNEVNLFFCLRQNRSTAKAVDHPSVNMGHVTTTTLVYDNLNNNVKPITKDCLDQSMTNGIMDGTNSNNNNLSKICIRDRDDVDDNIGDSKICDNTENKVGNGEVNADKKDNSDGYTYFGFIKVNAKLKWDNIIGIIVIHTMFLYSFLHWRHIPTHIMTYLWGFLCGGLGGFGVTGGAHRLWSHRAYSAKTPLRVILMLCFSLSGQNSLYDWVRDHRVHHKFSETAADPHDSNRGFFFAHVGWLMMNKHPEVVRKGRMLDMSDILNDPVVQFHQKFFIPLKLLLCFIIPTVVPMYFWGESFFWSFYSQCVLRYVFNLNFTWLVNSAAHMWGTRPYDKRINPVQNLYVSIVAMGEGWHNYHHVFPWDYKAAELGHYFNVTTFWIEQFAKIGWAYDLKKPSEELIRNTIRKHGDNTHPITFGHHLSEVPPPDECTAKDK